MRDRVLTLAELMRLKLPPGRALFLAFLSAWETAKIDESSLFDPAGQNVNLAATALFVGFKSVVGTMW